MTVKDCLKACKALPNISVRRFDGEYRVTISPSKLLAANPSKTQAWAIQKAEAIAYYGDDEEDVVATAAVISAHFDLHGPRELSGAH